MDSTRQKLRSATAFQDLPEELITYILQKVSPRRCTAELNAFSWNGSEGSSLAVLARVSTVSTQIKRLCSDPDLYRHVAIRKKLPAGTLQWLSARASNLETLSFSDLKAAADCSQPPLHISRAFDPVFPKPVQSKYLFAPDPALYMPGIEALLRASGATLRSIELTAVSSVFSQGILGRIARHCPNLLQITLNENQFAGAHGGLCQIAAGCPLVESFTISEMEYEMRSKNSSLNDNTMGELVFGWPNLRHISIDRNEVTLRGLCLLRHCENLETLHFGFPRDCGDSFFEGVPGPELMVLSRSLQSIDLNVPAITVSGTIRPLVHLCPNLKVIDMVHDEWADQDDLEDGVLDIAEDMALLQQEYPHILFKNFGKVIKQGDLV